MNFIVKPLMALFLFAVISCIGADKKSPQTTDAQVFPIGTNLEEKLLSASKDSSIEIIDLRTPKELLKTGIIEGAITKNFYENDFDQFMKTLDKEKKYIVYCHSGGRSAKAESKMRDAGLKAVNYGPGITGWLAKGHKTIPWKSNANL